MTPDENEPTAISKSDKEVTAVPVEADEATNDDPTKDVTTASEVSSAKEIDVSGAVEAGPLDTATARADVADRVPDVADDADADAVEADTTEADAAATTQQRRFPWSKLLAYIVVPVLALILAVGAGYLWWQQSKAKAADTARIESVQTAKDSTVKLLSYKPDTVDKDLGSARDLLTGAFRDSYTQLTNDVVIPGSKEKQISAVASVPAVASVSADAKHAVALVFVNQTVVVGAGAPTSTASSVQVTMDKVDGRWLISGFDPI